MWGGPIVRFVPPPVTGPTSAMQWFGSLGFLLQSLFFNTLGNKTPSLVFDVSFYHAACF